MTVPRTGAVRVEVRGSAPTVGLRLLPEAARPLLGFTPAEMPHVVMLEELWDDRWLRRLTAELRRSTSVERQHDLLEAAVTRRIERDDRSIPDPVVAGARAQLEGGRAVEETARAVGVSVRQLRRRFSSDVGLGPKSFQRIARFQRFLRLRDHPAGRERLADLAVSAGYADQSHLTHECRRLAGTTPRALVDFHAGGPVAEMRSAHEPWVSL